MATYYQGGASEIQAGDNNLQTLYLMNPSFITTTTTTPDYSDQTHQHHNHHHHQQQQQHIMLNPTVTPNTLTHGIIPQHHHPQLVGIPLAGPHHHSASGADLSRADLSRTSLHHHNHHLNQMASAINGLVGPRAHYASTGLWSPASDAGPAQSGPIQDFPGQGQGQGQARGGLSLSLSPGLQRARAEGDDGRMSVTLAGPGPMVGSKYLKAAQELLEEVVNVADNNNNVGGGDRNNNNNNNNMESSKGKAVVEEGGGDDDVTGGGDGGESSKKGGELSMAQRHELQMKKAKLLNMLDEVDQRYRQYNTQMQIIASSFEQAAGIGSAKSYTSLALKTISKQFRTLKDAISSQIKAANKSLGEESIVGVKLEGGVGSRLRLVDQQISQHRALQQLGMMQHSHNAWRPQRGLPERAVSVLRAWLFEHFLHPYPKDSDKHMLAKQTGLTRSQVSNWFINARVRLWKPMVEEMYVEEMKSHEQNNIIPTDDTTTTTTTTNNGGEIGGSSSKNERNQDLSTTNKTTIITQQQHQQPQQQGDLGFDNNQQTTNDMISSLSTMSTTSPQGFTLIGSSSDMETLMARSQKKHRSNNNSDMNSPSSILSMDMEMKPIDHHQQQQHQQQQQPKYGQYSSSMTSIHGGTGYNNPFIMNNNHNNIGRLFSQNQLTTASYHGNAVALTLGLPHCDNNNNNNNNGNNISLSENHHQQNFFPSNQGMDLGRRVEIGANEGDFCGSNIGGGGGGGGHETSHPSNNVVYESIDIQSRKRFAAQILHDFVA